LTDQPGKGAFHNPTFWKNLKTSLIFWLSDNF
jgi:hypothetical protein